VKSKLQAKIKDWQHQLQEIKNNRFEDPSKHEAPTLKVDKLQIDIMLMDKGFKSS
jgi:hypothetical protein